MFAQYALIAVVVIGLLTVVLISARNYSPTEWIILGFFVVVVMFIGTKYFFEVDIAASIKNITKDPQINLEFIKSEADKAKLAKLNMLQGKQVFHVPGRYNYHDAKALCKAYGSDVANIEQLYDAYKKGAEWCDYGWSDNQMALYPTQTKTWEKFQKSADPHKKSCGRPGINGGYTMDLNQLLGVNCFGPKPAQLDKKIQSPPFPPDPLDEQASKYKKDLPNVSGFNYQKWSQ